MTDQPADPGLPAPEPADEEPAAVAVDGQPPTDLDPEARLPSAVAVADEEPPAVPVRPAAAAPPITAAETLAADLRVAHVLLRSGNALPARVQLETLAGRSQLDGQGSLDLAESRWRTGDLAGAGEAAVAYLEAGGTMPLAYLIAAESASANGRPGEARKLARQTLEGLTLSLDAVFAGQPRSSIWPHDPAQPVQPAGTLFAAGGVDAAHGGRIGLTAAVAIGAAPRAPSRPGLSPAVPVADESRAPEHGRPAEATRADAPEATMTAELAPHRTLWEPPEPTMPDVQVELDNARAALAAGDDRIAAMRLSIVLRMSPVLAPAVLDLVGQMPGVDFDLLRGDALRLVGHEAAAERAFAAAADALRGTTPPRSSE